MNTFEHDGLTFQVNIKGEPTKGTVILLHGFPQEQETWYPLRDILVGAGYQVLIPLQRGYSPGARPTSISEYRLESLVSDIKALIALYSTDGGIHIVGHDWGGAVAWALASHAPELLSSLTVLSMPHPNALTASLVRSLQVFDSWYIVPLILPGFLKLAVSIENGAFGRRWLQSTALPTVNAETYVDVLRDDPGRPNAICNWYRALPWNARYGLRAKKITVPTLYVWGSADVAISAKAAALTAKYVTAKYHFDVFEGGSHWLPETASEQLAPKILAHLRRHDGSQQPDS